MFEKIRQIFTATNGETIKLPQPKKKTLSAGVLSLFGNNYLGNTGAPSGSVDDFEGWVYANVNARARAVSRTEFELYRIRTVGGEIEYLPILEHPFLELLDHFNTYLSLPNAIYLTQAYIDLVGDCFWYVDDSMENIHIIRPDKTTIKFNYDEGQPIIDDYVFKDVVNNKPIELHYEPERITPFINPNPANQIRGKSILGAAKLTVDIDKFAGLWNKMFFENNAVPDNVFRTDQRLDKDDIERLEAEIKRKFKGVGKSHKSLILGGGLTVEKLQSTARDMEFQKQQEWTRDKLMALFGNTKVSLGIVEDVNRANAEASLYLWLKENIKPAIKLIVDNINEYLLPQFTQEPLILGFKDPYPEEREGKLKEATAGHGKWLTTNEARQLLGYDQLTYLDGEVIPFQTGFAPVSEMPKSIANINWRKSFRQIGIFKQITDYQTKETAKKEIKTLAKQIASKKIKPKPIVQEAKPKPERKLSDYYSNEKIREYYAKRMQNIEGIENKFRDKLHSFINSLEEKALGKLAKIEEKGIVKIAGEPIYDVEMEVKAGIGIFKPLFDEIILAGGITANELLNIQPNFKPSASLEKQITKLMRKFTKSLVTTDADKVSQIIIDGVRAGTAIPSMARDIKEFFVQARKKQAETIVRTEVLRANHLASLDAWKASNVVEAQQWITMDDDLVCDFCAPMHNKTIGLDDSYFEKGDTVIGLNGATMKIDYLSVDTPPLHPNCRCDIVAVPVSIDKIYKELVELKSYTDKLEDILDVKDK